jgi:hypothetical protein
MSEISFSKNFRFRESFREKFSFSQKKIRFRESFRKYFLRKRKFSQKFWFKG